MKEDTKNIYFTLFKIFMFTTIISLFLNVIFTMIFENISVYCILMTFSSLFSTIIFDEIYLKDFKKRH